MHQVEIVTRPEVRVIGVPHRGAYNRIGAAFERLDTLVHDAGFGPEIREFLAIYHDDPGAVPEEDLRSMAGIVVRDDLALPDGFEQARLPAGRFAVLTHRGPYDGLPAAWGWFMGTWAPGSSLGIRPGAAFEIYRNDPAVVAPEDLLTELGLPVE